MITRKRRRGFTLVLAAGLFLSSCAQLKQCAYEGLNRDNWQQPQKVIAALEIPPGATVADIGAGSGYFTFKLAEAVGPTGKVYAVDIDPDMVNLIGRTIKEKTVGNVEPILAKPDESLLPKNSVDLVFTSNTYHHIENRVAYFADLRQRLRPAGRLAIVELDGRSWIENFFGHSTPSESIQREMEQAGYTLKRKFDFLDRQSFQIFVPQS
jgi:arsenite methyltransferase